MRYLGSEVGKKVARPDTKGEVLELAAKRLNLSTPASRIFAASPTSGLYCTIGRRLCRLSLSLVQATWTGHSDSKGRASHVPEQALRTGHSTRTVALVG